MSRKWAIPIWLVVFLAWLNEPLSAQSYDLSITEINYHPDSTWNSQDWVELYNYGSEEIDLSGWFFKDESVINEYIIPDGTVIQPGQYRILAERVDTFNMIYPDVTNLIGPFAFGLDNGGGLIRLFDDEGFPVISIAYGDTLPWPKSADGYGPTMEVIDPTDNLNDPSNWFGGCVGGSPGGPYEDCNYAIQVNEINYNSIFFHDSGDWIELVNSSASPIDISNWRLRDSDDNNQFIIPSGTTLEPDERLVLVQDLFQFATYYMGIENIMGDLGFGFSGQGDAIRIYDDALKLQYALYYHDDPPWPEPADGDGYTLELLDFFGTPNVSGAWTEGCIYGSPGTAIVLPCPTSIEEYNALPFTAGPIPFGSALYIQMDLNLLANAEWIELLDLSGRIVFSENITTPNLLLNTGELSPGVYLLRLYDSQGEAHSLRVVKGS